MIRSYSLHLGDGYPAPSNFSPSSNLYIVFAKLENAVKQACAIYSYRTLNDMCPDGIGVLLNVLKETVMGIPSYTPGENSLAWVYFIAAAESSTLGDRTFFAKRLMGIYERGTFEDVTSAFGVLNQIWNLPEGASWANVLLQMPSVFR